MAQFPSIEVITQDGTAVGRVIATIDEMGIKVGGLKIVHDEEFITYQLIAGTAIDTYIWTNESSGVWQVSRVSSIISVTGGTGLTVQLRVCSGVTAIAAGVAQLSAALDLEEVVPSRQQGVVIAAPTNIYPGDSLALDFSGTPGTVSGVVTVAVKRVS